MTKTVSLTHEEKKKLKKGIFATLFSMFFFMFAVMGVAYLITINLDKDMFFIMYIVWGFFGLVFAVILYQLYATWRDIQAGTKQVFRAKILDKEHRITRSSSGTGTSRTTTTNHYYSFDLEGQAQLSVSEDQYKTFTQGQTIQVEKLSYSGSLWAILLVTEAGEALPAEPPSSKNQFKPNESALLRVPLEQDEKAYLEKLLSPNPFWLVFSLTAIVSILFVPTMMLLPLFLGYYMVSYVYVLVTCVLLALAYTIRNVRQTKARYLQDVSTGVELTRLQLVDKEVVNSGGEVHILIFENRTRVNVSGELYDKLHNKQSYWVGKVDSYPQPLFIQDDTKQQKWKLF